eukprot:6866109-Lingulodinium_polyedra.AAC.1
MPTPCPTRGGCFLLAPLFVLLAQLGETADTGLDEKAGSSCEPEPRPTTKWAVRWAPALPPQH